MSRIEKRFDALRRSGRQALIPYITAGDPSPAATPELMHALVAAGADIIELGVPFSDPMADGPAIQAACERALAQGTRLSGVLDCAARFRDSDADTPLVLMGYINPIESMGLAQFAERAARAGVDGVLIVDMTVEEAPETLPVLRGQGLDAICLVAPTTTVDRMRCICEHSTGFIYYVSSKGVTGGSGVDAAVLADQIAAVREQSDEPVAVGFGIREPRDAAAVAEVADGVVVGSALVRRIAETSHDELEATKRVLYDTLSAIRRAMDANSPDTIHEASP